MTDDIKNMCAKARREIGKTTFQINWDAHEFNIKHTPNDGEVSVLRFASEIMSKQTQELLSSLEKLPDDEATFGMLLNIKTLISYAALLGSWSKPNKVLARQQKEAKRARTKNGRIKAIETQGKRTAPLDDFIRSELQKSPRPALDDIRAGARRFAAREEINIDDRTIRRHVNNLSGET